MEGEPMTRIGHVIHAMFVRADARAVGARFIALGAVAFTVGGLLSLMMRWQLAFPSFSPQVYNATLTMHSTIMVFFVVITVLFSGFGNLLVPQMVSADRSAFPKTAAAAFWMTAAGLIVLVTGFLAPGGASASGWSGYPPLSSLSPDGLVARSINGQTLWFVSLILFAVGNILTAINLLTTLLVHRDRSISILQLPLTPWSVAVTSVLVILSTPPLVVVMVMNLMDLHGLSAFFRPADWVIGSRIEPSAGGGVGLLHQHLFWFYAHPAVYIMILPAMGMVSDILARHANRAIFGYRAMVLSMAAIAALGFVVWGHHMFQSGMNPALGTSFAVATMLIAVPSAVKTFNWIATLAGGRVEFTPSMLAAIAFVSMFVIGGLSGIFMASTPVDVHIHNTYFIVAHLHYTLFGGSIFGIFAAVYHWWPALAGRTLSPALGRVHVIATYAAFHCVFFPMHILGLHGFPRRLSEFTQYESLAGFAPWQRFMTYAAFALGAAQLVLLWNLIASAHRRSQAGT
jgi:cytochrome c oxidase subunit 1